jgi:hypothetical protein
LESGIFFFMLAFAFGFMIWGFVRSASLFTSILRIISIVMFMGLAMFMGAGQEVTTTTNESVTSQGIGPNGEIIPLVSNSTTTNTIIPSSEGSWLSWIFMGFAILNMILVIREAFA